MSSDGLYPISDDLGLGATIRGYAEGQVVFDRYTLRQIVGRGGMGVVWLARDEKLDEDVALKFLPELVRLDAPSLDELKRETRRSRALTHPHIVRIHDFVDDATAAAISMEYVDGPSLSALRLQQPNRVFAPVEIAGCLAQLFEALSYAHERAKIAHRDLKPANLMINSRSELKVADFGIASSLSDSVSRVTMQRGSSGTLAYMSPQQAMGQKPSPTDDIYSVGATIYELLTSKPPFYSGNIQHQLETIVPPAMAERRADFEIDGAPIPAEWEDVVAACLAKDPIQRPQSVAEVAHRLGLGGAPALAVSAEPPVVVPLPIETTEHSPPRKSFAIPLTVTFLVLGIGGAFGWYYGMEKPAEEKRAIESARIEAEQSAEKEKQVEARQAAATAAAAKAKADADAAAAAKAKVDAEAAAAAAKAKADADAKAAAQKTREDVAKTPINTDTPLDDLQKAADASSPAAENELGRRYRKGLGVALDFKQALVWYQKAADQGDALGQSNVGEMYQFGLGLPADYAQAIAWYQKAADQGNADGEINLGRMYQTGLGYGGGRVQGVPVDYNQAYSWLQKAADQKSARALTFLAFNYLFGRGGRRDLQKALELLREAADLGNASAADRLGFEYMNGSIVAKDPEQSHQWFCKAFSLNMADAQKGDAEAQAYVASAYQYGQYGHGIQKDPAQSQAWYAKAAASYQPAADQGDASALGWFAQGYTGSYGLARDVQRAAAYYEKEADLVINSVSDGLINNLEMVALLYRDNVLTPDEQRAQYWDQRAFAVALAIAETGDIVAQIHVGSLYLNGAGIAKDDQQAAAWFEKAALRADIPTYNAIGQQYFWYALNKLQKTAPAQAQPYYLKALPFFQKAADGQNPVAQFYLGEMYEDGYGVKKSQDQAISWYRKSAAQKQFWAVAALKRLHVTP